MTEVRRVYDGRDLVVNFENNGQRMLFCRQSPVLSTLLFKFNKLNTLAELYPEIIYILISVEKYLFSTRKTFGK